MQSLPAGICPLCQQQNRCAMAKTGRSDAHCWCHEVSIPASALRAAAAQGEACVCSDCASPLPE